MLRDKPALSAALDTTVAGSCLGSPTRTTLPSGFSICSGISAAGSTACAACSRANNVETCGQVCTRSTDQCRMLPQDRKWWVHSAKSACLVNDDCIKELQAGSEDCQQLSTSRGQGAHDRLSILDHRCTHCAARLLHLLATSLHLQPPNSPCYIP